MEEGRQHIHGYENITLVDKKAPVVMKDKALSV